MAALVDGMAAARKLSASLGSPKVNPLLESPDTPTRPFQKAQEGPQEAPGALQTATDGQDIVVTIRVPLMGFWKFLKGVADGQ